MRGNADITLFHKVYNEETRLDEYTKTQYKDVHFHGKQAVSVQESGLNTASAYTVRIFTLAEIAAAIGDIVVLGLIDDVDVNAATSGTNKYFTVTAIVDNRRGSVQMQHWRVEGK